MYSQHERMRRSGVRCDDSRLGANRLFWIHVHYVHEPTRVAGSYRHHDEVEWAARLSDRTELRVIGSIAREIRATPSFFDGESAL